MTRSPRKERPKRANLGEPITLRLEPDEESVLRDVAEELGLSFSSYLRMVLKKHISNLQKSEHREPPQTSKKHA